MKIIKLFFLFVAVAVIVAGITLPLWFEKTLPYFSGLTASNPNTFSEYNYNIIDIPPGMPEINADREYIPIIISILNHTDKNIVRFIKSITIMDDMNKLRTICGDAVGCAVNTFENDVFISSSIYVASKNNYDSRCGTFEMIFHHEIGHVVYSYQNGMYSKEKSETFARNYAGKYFDPVDAYKKVAMNFDLNELKCVY
jgi:hypothetical protein